MKTTASLQWRRAFRALTLMSIVAISTSAWSASDKVSVPGIKALTALPVAKPESKAPPAPAKTPTSAASRAAVSPAPAARNSDAIPRNDSDYNSLVSALGREHYILTLESQNADLKKKISDAQGASLPPPSVIVAPPASMSPQSGVPGAPPHDAPSTITISDMGTVSRTVHQGLRLVSVLGVDGSYQATVVDHGVNCVVQSGSTLSDGWRVERIAPSTVVLVRGRHHRILHVSA